MSFCQEDFNCHIDFLRYVGMQDWLEVGKMAKKIIFCPGCGKAHLQNTTITKIIGTGIVSNVVEFSTLRWRSKMWALNALRRWRCRTRILNEKGLKLKAKYLVKK